MQPSSDATIRCRDLRKRYNGTSALDGFTLDVEQGRILGLLGPSGCGKTTALRIIAGFEPPDRGSVEIGGRTVVGPGASIPPEQRRVGMVFQDYALFPHLSVAGNVGYGVPRAERRRRVSQVLELVGLSPLADRMPHELSGGEQQRVALARALAPRPEVVLLDEPFSNLDAPQRDRVRREVRAILIDSGITAVFVTHDQEEALAMSDVVAVMRRGRVLQVGTPPELYHRPKDGWVARFVGEAEFLHGTGRNGKVETELGIFETAHEGPIEVMVRPEAVRLASDPAGEGRVIEREFYGHDQLVVVQLETGQRVLARLGPAPVYDLGERVSVSVVEAVTFPLPD